MSEQHAKVRDTLLRHQEEMKRQYDRRHQDRVHFDNGEVLVILRQPEPGQSTKL